MEEHLMSKKATLTVAELEPKPITVKADAMKPNDTPIRNVTIIKIPASKGGAIVREDYK